MPDDKQDHDKPEESFATESGSGFTDPRSVPFKRLGDFEVIKEIGRGGMGIVYEARQITLNRKVALKVLPSELGMGPEAKIRFEREARAAARLHHTNIVPIHAFGEDKGYSFYAMELIDGQSLNRILDDLSDGRGSTFLDETMTVKPPSFRETEPKKAERTPSRVDSLSSGRDWFDWVARLIADVAEALDYAHSNGIIHRDIKPGNLLLSRDGRLSITDFGLARTVQDPGMTVSGALLGTPAYMSPEQIAAGKIKIDHRTDIYSLGVVLYEVLTMQRPYQGDSREEVISQILTKEPKQPRRVNHRIPIDLETICLKAMEKNADSRYQTAGLMAQDLRLYLLRELITARRAGPIRRTMKFIRRHPIASTVAASLILIVAIGGFAWRASTLRSKEEVQRIISDAKLDLSEGLYREGLEKIEKAVARDPDSPAARLIRAQLLIRLFREKEAIAEADAILKKDPNDWTGHAILAFAASRSVDKSMSPEEHIKAVEKYAPETAEAYYLRSIMTIFAPQRKMELLNRALELNPNHVDAIISRISTLREMRNFQEALIDCERLISVKPRSAQGHLMKSHVYRSQKDYGMAMDEINKAIKLDPKDAACYSARAYLYAAMGKTQEQLADCNQAIKLESHNQSYYFDRSHAYSALSQYQDQIADLQRVLELDPDNYAAYDDLLGAYWKLKEKDKIRSTLAQLEKKATTWKSWNRDEAYLKIAEYTWYLGDHDQALSYYHKAIDKQPEYIFTWMKRAAFKYHTEGESAAKQDAEIIAQWDPGNDAVAHFAKGSLAFSGLWSPWNDDALKDFKKAIELEPLWADPYKERGVTLMYEKRYEEALPDLNRAIELQPKWTDAIYSRGLLMGRMEQFEEALKDFDNCIELGAASQDLMNQQAWALMHLKRYDEAFKVFGRMVELNPQNDWVYRMRGNAFLVLGRVDEALADHNKAVEVQPTSAYAYWRRSATLFFVPNRCKEAMDDLKKATELALQDPESWSMIGGIYACYVYHFCPQDYDPVLALDLTRKAVSFGSKNAMYIANLGVVQYRQGLYEEARQSLKKSIELNFEKDPLDHFFMAMTCWKLGHKMEARSYYDQAVARMNETYPKNPSYLFHKEEASTLLGLKP